MIIEPAAAANWGTAGAGPHQGGKGDGHFCSVVKGAAGTLVPHGIFMPLGEAHSELLSPKEITTRTGSSCYSAFLITPTVALTLTNVSAFLGLLGLHCWLLSANRNNEDPNYV